METPLDGHKEAQKSQNEESEQPFALVAFVPFGGHPVVRFHSFRGFHPIWSVRLRFDLI